MRFYRQRYSESGNIFLAIFGAVALVGLLGASIMTFMKGPLSTSVRLTKINTAENQMAIGSQVAVMAAANQANNGDCDGDGTIEPVEWRSPTVEPVPTGGGLVPLSIGISRRDPWGTEYGYCVWNYGSITAQAGTCGANMLQGTASTAYPVVAIISAGPDKTFTTTCRDFGVADTNHNGTLESGELALVSKAAETDDDIITSYTYEEATGVSGGLWSLKAGSPGTAVINKSIEASGVANLKGGVLLPDKSFITCTDPLNAGVMAKSALGIEICDGSGGWTSIGGASGALGTTATCAAPADAGHIRYNSTSGQPEFCNGTQWLPFNINTPGVNLVISPSNNNTMNVNGASNQDTVKCTVASGFTCGSGVTFTVTNAGTTTSGTTAIQVLQTINGVVTTYSAATLASVANTSNFVLTANTCTTTLAVNGTCTVTLEPKATGNTTYTATLKVNINNTPLAVISGTATNFGCTPGRQGGGGIYSYCGLTDANTGASYDLIVQPGGCTGSTNNPVCAGGTDTVTKIAANGCCTGAQVGTFSNYIGSDVYGARNSMTVMKMVSVGFGTFPAVQYCRQMNYGGYTDWYLPSRQEMVSFVYPNKTAIGGFQNNVYSTSLIGTNSDYGYVDMSGGGNGGEGVGYSRYVRCARRENIPLPTIPTLNTPVNMSAVPGVSFIAGARMSTTATVSGILDPMTVSISGSSGTPTFKVNGGAEVTTATVTNGQTVQFLMDAPSVMGTQYSATINWGPTQVVTWKTGYADSSRVLQIFVTSGTYGQGTTWPGGLSGADTICSNVAAASTSFGLSAKWKALLSDDTVAAGDRVPWNWGIMKNLNGQTVVDGGLSDLFDGSLDAPVGFDQNGNSSTAFTWTGSTSNGGIDPNSFNAAMGSANHGCNNWTSGYTYASNYTYAMGGYANQASASWIASSTANCNTAYALYCIEDIDGAVDTIPTAINPAYVVQGALSSRQTSAAKVIGGMSQGATTTLSVTATGGNPKFTINGGAEVASGTIKNGDSIMFFMDAPATASTSYKMTISSTSGATTVLGYWRVWSGWDGNGSGVKRVFVTSTDPNGTTFGGVAGADPVCQARAAAGGLGGTWKAILSGLAESEWAVNRVGYNWNELRLIDNTTKVAYAPNLWSTLLNPIAMTELGATRSGVRVLSGTASNGNSYSSVSDLSNLYNWTGGACSATYYQGNSSALTAGVSQGYWLCQTDGALFCIEQ